MSTASEQEKANLARVRDNQRRSRTRRREYLQELESRLRQCELDGIEASAEIQMAARKVADENRKLRGLLAVQGVADDNIEAFLQSSPTNDVLLSSQIPSQSAPVQTLQHLLQTRKGYCTAKSTNNISQHSHHNLPHYQNLASVTTSGNRTPSSMVSQSQMTELDPRLSQASPQYITHQPAPQQLQSHGTLQSSYIPTTTSSPNVNSCMSAADMISTIAGGDPNIVSADLGCLPGIDCDVDNQLVFNVMDRYS